MNVQEVINLLRSAESPEQIVAANKMAAEFLKSPDWSDQDKEAIRQAKSNAVNTMLDQHELEQQEALRYIALNGKTYSLADWLTPVEYARQYSLRSANNVTAWMMRGIIPQEDILEIPELNGLRLVRNRPYKSTSLEVGS